MTCPHCGHTKAKTVESRQCSNGTRKRRFLCRGCAGTYTLYFDGPQPQMGRPGKEYSDATRNFRPDHFGLDSRAVLGHLLVDPAGEVTMPSALPIPKRRPINGVAYALLLRRLVYAPYSYKELADATGLNEQTIRKWMIALRAAKLVHIASWDQDRRGGWTIPEFAWGPNKSDVRPPDPLTGAERAQRMRDARRKAKDASLLGLVGEPA